jgi:transcriptional regulator with XRE-family HTH domain
MKNQTALRILRERAGLSQKQLGDILGRTQPEVSMWENGKERMPDAIRYQILGALRAAPALSDAASPLQGAIPYLKAEDLDRPWDDVREDWALRRALETTSP